MKFTIERFFKDLPIGKENELLTENKFTIREKLQITKFSFTINRRESNKIETKSLMKHNLSSLSGRVEER